MSTTRLLRLTVLIIAILCVGRRSPVMARDGSERGLLPWAANEHPDDVARSHVERVDAARHRYTVTQRGTMDGQNCRSPIGVFEGWEQSWESNRSVRLENVGRVNVVNPWLSNGRNNFRTAEEIIRSAIEPGMSDREKAIALWHQETRHRYHFSTWDQEDNNPVKVFNSYGYNTCGDDSMCLAGLWRIAGLDVRPARLMGHCVSQVFYDGRWHLMDGDMASVYLLRDNKTIASERDLVRDHDLIKRSRAHGILAPDDRHTSEWEASLYIYDGDEEATRNFIGNHTMNMVLRPHEAIVWRWGHLEPAKFHGGGINKLPDTVCNGIWQYRPNSSDDTWRDGAASVKHVRVLSDGLAAEAGKVGTIVWRMHSPYVFVGGNVRPEGRGLELALSWDGNVWRECGSDLDEFFPSDGPARYEYFLRCQLSEQSRLVRFEINNDLQMAPLALPETVVGDNEFVYTDESTEQRRVRITHRWIERSISRPPPPPEAIFPDNGEVINGSEIVLRWTIPVDADGDKIADYHVQLSDRQDMRWPLSTNFDKLVSRTRDRGLAQYTLPYAGLLRSDQAYYWRVRARDDQGVWGDWSETSSFTPRAPACPVNVSIQYDSSQRTAILRWTANSEGTRPVKYRVYGSDEKGFSVSDVPYRRNIGNQPTRLASTVPANFITETVETELAVAGQRIELPNANRAFYRVVAIDMHGARSGPSDFAAAPRPLIHSTPVVEGTVGEEYRYPVLTIRSLGDLRCRVKDGELAMNYWDVERPRFTLERGPEWLEIDPATGLLEGQPSAAGKFEVVVSATIDRELRLLDSERLSWGQQKLTGTSTENLGTARQQFEIDVRSAAPR